MHAAAAADKPAHNVEVLQLTLASRPVPRSRQLLTSGVCNHDEQVGCFVEGQLGRGNEGCEGPGTLRGSVMPGVMGAPFSRRKRNQSAMSSALNLEVKGPA